MSERVIHRESSDQFDYKKKAPTATTPAIRNPPTVSRPAAAPVYVWMPAGRPAVVACGVAAGSHAAQLPLAAQTGARVDVTVEQDEVAAHGEASAW